MQHLQAEQASISLTIETILEKGGQKLYESYIKEKLPQHASGQTSDSIERNFGVGFTEVGAGGGIRGEKMPAVLGRDSLLPGKIGKEKGFRRTEDEGVMTGNLSFREAEGKRQNNSGVMTQRTGTKKYTPKLRQKISINCKSLLNPEQQKIPQQELSIRKTKVQRQQKQQSAFQNQQRRQQEKLYKKRKLEKEVEELEILGIPYVYDDQGNIHSPDKKEFKYVKEKNQRLLRKKDKIMGLQHDTIDLGCIERYVKDVRSVVGRKKGYFSSQFYKKLRMTNQEYNNQNGRQNSTIPFLNLAQGIRIVQRERNVYAQKQKKPILTLSEYKQKTQSHLFKSFIPDYESISTQTMSIDRPYTTGQFNRTKRTAQTSITQKMNNSILWRPKTTSKGCRMNVNNQELARTVMRVEE